MLNCSFWYTNFQVSSPSYPLLTALSPFFQRLIRAVHAFSQLCIQERTSRGFLSIRDNHTQHIQNFSVFHYIKSLVYSYTHGRDYNVWKRGNISLELNEIDLGLLRVLHFQNKITEILLSSSDSRFGNETGSYSGLVAQEQGKGKRTRHVWNNLFCSVIRQIFHF